MLGLWFWILMLFAILSCGFAGWGTSGERKWGWSYALPFAFVLAMLAILATKVFGGPLK